jgi:hypothetical protein
MLLFVVSLFLPAIYLGDDHMFGVAALYLSLIGWLMVPGLDDIVVLGTGQWSACVVGALGNLLFVFSYLALALRQHFQRGLAYRTCKIVALSAIGFMLSVNIPLVLGSDAYFPNIGHVIWIAAAALLAYAAHKKVELLQDSEESGTPPKPTPIIPLVLGPIIASLALAIEHVCVALIAK